MKASSDKTLIHSDVDTFVKIIPGYSYGIQNYYDYQILTSKLNLVDNKVTQSMLNR
ncbi:MAG: hypothetical protein HBSAPP01_01190 [Candidatus Brocadia sapporoensis]|uniref:hypothetical protein n=1 Tax=Candidatus Brocadia sapporoensis TaxID=392547 RepID=UPI0015C4DBD0|nr:hypothetical protein [Candidatus Brocadia sapporoensis]GJQ22329.1 MAG: hypothetical protein HBSAPP01_01190 [Candidatus Brocadia sapporoensis]